MKNYEKLQIIKKLSDFTQERLAKELNVSFATLNSWINDKSEPHKKSQDLINELYRKYTGQKTIPKDTLSSKKEIILQKSKKDILRFIYEKPDLYEEITLRLTYNTNSIEGSTLSENQTAAILFQNKSLSNKTLIEQMEAKNHQAAMQFLFKYLIRGEKINEELILRLHAILMNGIRDDAGFYRNHGVRIVGSNVPTANYLKIPDLMSALSRKLQIKHKDLITFATKVHSEFEKIHPFSDGNGRVGRLILAAMLLEANLPPAIILQENKQLYYSYLRKSQLEEDHSLLEDFICDAILYTDSLFTEQ
jgi:Fic family protein